MHRSKAILLISQLSDAMKYKTETLYVAVSIMDRYLINMISINEKAPCLVTLGVVVLMIAAKLEDAKKVSVRKLSQILEE